MQEAQMRNRIVGALLSGAAGLACSGAGSGSATTEDDIVAVARLMVTLDRIQAEEDLEAFLQLVSDDAVYMPPNEPAVVGKRAIGDWYSTFYGLCDMEITHEPLEVDVAGDYIIHRGNARGTMTPADGGSTLSFENKYLMVIKKRPDGSLQVWRAIFNSN